MMYKDVQFKLQPMEWIEEDLKELAEMDPHAKTIQLLSANPLCMSYDKLAPILEMINKYLPEMEYIYGATRVTDIRNKTVDQLKSLKELGLREISLGVDAMIDPDCKDKDLLALVTYISADERAEKVMENQSVIRQPIVRNGRQATVGYAPDVWKTWQ